MRHAHVPQTTADAEKAVKNHFDTAADSTNEQHISVG